MRGRITRVLVLLLFGLAARAETADSSRWSFEHYPAVKDFRGNPAKPILLTPHERIFRTQIRTQARTGPNFAGHYTVVKWGCGAPCLAFAIVNARTGAIYAPVDQVFTVGCSDGTSSDATLEFNIESRLIKATGFSEKFGCGTNYFV